MSAVDLLQIASDERRRVELTPDEAQSLLDALSAAEARAEQAESHVAQLQANLAHEDEKRDALQAELANVMEFSIDQAVYEVTEAQRDAAQHALFLAEHRAEVAERACREAYDNTASERTRADADLQALERVKAEMRRPPDAFDSSGYPCYREDRLRAALSSPSTEPSKGGDDE